MYHPDVSGEIKFGLNEPLNYISSQQVLKIEQDGKKAMRL